MKQRYQTEPVPRFVDIIPLADHELPRILVADDDPLTAEQLAAIADGESFRVVSVRDGREAYRILRADSGFRAVIINTQLPHLRGVEIVRYMKSEKRLARVPIVIVSGNSGLRVIADSFAAGAMAFLPKPFTAEQLRRVLRIAISGAPQVALGNAA